MTERPVPRKRRKIDLPLAIEICRRIQSGEYNHDIAADYGLNQGRISEIRTGKRFPEAWEIARGQGRA